MLYKTKREKRCEEEESIIPCLKDVYIMMQEMAYKYKKMEERLDEMHKWIDKKKSKLNVISWLNINTNTNVLDLFNDWINKIVVSEEEMLYLSENNFVDTIISIFKKNFVPENTVVPIVCFKEKANVFYIYSVSVLNDDGYDYDDEVRQRQQQDTSITRKSWIKMSSKDFMYLIRMLHSKLLKCLCKWKDKNEDTILKNTKMNELYNKLILKLLNDWKSESSISKIRVSIFNLIKKELKELITDFEFEFD